MKDAGEISRFQRHLTLGMTTVLHGFTHAYGTLLVPLYLLMVADLHLRGVSAAGFVVTLSGIVYCLGSYPAGVLADRVDRKWLLGIGLMGHALAMLAMGLTRSYEVLVMLGVVAGVFGALYHPCANALVPAHYPRNPGLAIGVLGMGSGLGFFAGPQYAGWRAESAGWRLGAVADWQRPCVEMGVVGVAFAVLYLAFAKEARRATGDAVRKAVMPPRMSTEEIVMEYEPAPPGTYLSRAMRWRVAGIAAVLGCRDFAGVASMTLASIYLQKAYGYSAKQAGFTIGAMMLTSIVVSPLAVVLTQGRRRLPALSGVLVAGGAVLCLVPFFPRGWILPLMCLFQTFQLSSYAMSDAAMLERVPAEIRGRVVGLFLVLAGTFAAGSPFVVGYWTDLLRARADQPAAYAPIFGTLAGMMALSALATPLIAKLGQPAGSGQKPLEVVPA
jgi:MFS family permease